MDPLLTRRPAAAVPSEHTGGGDDADLPARRPSRAGDCHEVGAARLYPLYIAVGFLIGLERRCRGVCAASLPLSSLRVHCPYFGLHSHGGAAFLPPPPPHSPHYPTTSCAAVVVPSNWKQFGIRNASFLIFEGRRRCRCRRRDLQLWHLPCHNSSSLHMASNPTKPG